MRQRVRSGARLWWQPTTTAIGPGRRGALTQFLQTERERSIGEVCCAAAEIYATGRWSAADTPDG
jgi:hypothetical protein